MPASQLLAGKLPSGVPLLIVDCPQLYDRPGGPYQDTSGNDWPDNALRFGLLSYLAAVLAGAALADQLAAAHPPLQRLADRAGAGLPALHAAATRRARVMTIHNLAYQGIFPPHHRQPARVAAVVVQLRTASSTTATCRFSRPACTTPITSPPSARTTRARSRASRWAWGCRACLRTAPAR